jgi:hypothetical protein
MEPPSYQADWAASPPQQQMSAPPPQQQQATPTYNPNSFNMNMGMQRSLIDDSPVPIATPQEDSYGMPPGILKYFLILFF